MEVERSFNSIPQNIIFSFKRFQKVGANVTKDNRKVNYPLFLDLTSFLKSTKKKEGEAYYNLVAVVLHTGDLHNGHYMVLFRDDSEGDLEKWYFMDDHT